MKVLQIKYSDGLNTQFIGFIYDIIQVHTASATGSPPPSGSPPPCTPHVSVWNGIEYEQDNTMLLGNDNSALKGLDPYMLTKTPNTTTVDGNEYYKIKIEEDEPYETTTLDEMGMYVIDHPSDTNVYINDEEEIITYGSSQPPISAYDHNATDQLSKIEYSDEIYVDGYRNDSLTVDFGTISDLNLKLVVVSDRAPCSGQSPISLPDDEGPIDIEYLSNTGEWVHVDFLYPRSYWSTDVYDLTSNIQSLSDPLTIKFTWYAYHKIDSIGIDTSVPQPYDLTILDPYTFTYSEGNVDVLSILESADDEELEIPYNESVEALFVPPAESIYPERSFGVYLYGYYENWGIYENIDIEAIQDATLKVKVKGTPENTVKFNIYEDGELIDTTLINRTRGKPNEVEIPFERIMGKSYEIKLSYELYKGGKNHVDVRLFDPDGKIKLKKIKLGKKLMEYQQNIDTELDTLNIDSKTYQFRVIEKQQPVYLTISQYNWSFGDSQFSNEAMPYHSYEYGITHYVSVIVEYSNEDVSTLVSESIFIDVP